MEKREIEILTNTIARARKTIKEADAEFKKYCQDKSHPVQERYDIFTSCGLGDHVGWIENVEPAGIDLYQLCNEPSRHETVDTVGIWDTMLDNIRWQEEIDSGKREKGKYYEECTWTREQLDELTENILQEWCKSFEYDW